MSRRKLGTLIFGVVFLCLPGGLFAEKPAPEKKSAEKILSPKDISKTMAETWCQKLKSCAPESAMKDAECRGLLYDTFLQGFLSLPKEQKVELSESMLKLCLSSIEASQCQNLKTATSLEGCEFIGVLNQNVEAE